jgi:hypothetical protein
VLFFAARRREVRQPLGHRGPAAGSQRMRWTERTPRARSARMSCAPREARIVRIRVHDECRLHGTRRRFNPLATKPSQARAAARARDVPSRARRGRSRWRAGHRRRRSSTSPAGRRDTGRGVQNLLVASFHDVCVVLDLSPAMRPFRPLRDSMKFAAEALRDRARTLRRSRPDRRPGHFEWRPAGR